MRKKTRRKVWALVNPIQHAMDGAAITPRKELDRLLMREIASLDDFLHGRASLQQWSDLTTVVNLCETMASEGIGPEALEACGKAQSALLKSAKRFEKIHRFGLDGVGIQAVRDVIEFHDLQRSSISRSEYERMIRLTAARVKSGYKTTDVSEYDEKTDCKASA